MLPSTRRIELNMEGLNIVCGDGSFVDNMLGGFPAVQGLDFVEPEHHSRVRLFATATVPILQRSCTSFDRGLIATARGEGSTFYKSQLSADEGELVELGIASSRPMYRKTLGFAADPC